MITTIDKLEIIEEGIIKEINSTIKPYYRNPTTRNFNNTYSNLIMIKNILYSFESVNLCINLNNFIKHIESYIWELLDHMDNHNREPYKGADKIPSYTYYKDVL